MTTRRSIGNLLAMDDPKTLDELFCAAVAAIDAGDVTGLERLVAAHPTLVCDRLDAPLGLGVDLNSPSADLYSHATALHHAVYSGSLDAVKVLVEAGAALDVVDTIYAGTPLGWAEYGKHLEIAEYLRERGRK